MTTAYVTPYWQFKFNQDVQTINEYVFDNGRENRDYIVLFRCSDSSFEMKCKKLNQTQNIRQYSRFVWLSFYYLFLSYLKSTNNKWMKQINLPASLWTLDESLLHELNSFCSKVKLLLNEQFIWFERFFLKPRSNIFIVLSYKMYLFACSKHSHANYS